MSPGRLDADIDRYRQAAAANTPPPQVVSDPLVDGLTPVEQLLRILGLAANLGDDQDNTDSADEHGERDAMTTEAAEEFAAQDEEATAELTGVAPAAAAGQGSSAQMAQQIPQLAAGIAGALGGAMQPITQIPQQLAQGAQQALQAGMGLLQQSGGSSATLGDADLGDLAAEPLAEDFGAETGGFGDSAGGGGGGGLDGSGGAVGSGGGAAPAAMLGPPAPPSAGTFASSVRSAPAAPPPAPGHTGSPGGGMAGVPMVPPGAMNGAAVADKDAKTDTKRVSVPAVRNGAPVQGRIATPPTDTAATAKASGKPVATRRIIVARDGFPGVADPAGQP